MTTAVATIAKTANIKNTTRKKRTTTAPFGNIYGVGVAGNNGSIVAVGGGAASTVAVASAAGVASATGSGVASTTGSALTCCLHGCPLFGFSLAHPK
jgi:hypothetical protein